MEDKFLVCVVLVLQCMGVLGGLQKDIIVPGDGMYKPHTHTHTMDTLSLIRFKFSYIMKNSEMVKCFEGLCSLNYVPKALHFPFYQTLHIILNKLLMMRYILTLTLIEIPVHF